MECSVTPTRAWEQSLRRNQLISSETSRPCARGNKRNGGRLAPMVHTQYARSQLIHLSPDFLPLGGRSETRSRTAAREGQMPMAASNRADILCAPARGAVGARAGSDFQLRYFRFLQFHKIPFLLTFTDGLPSLSMVFPVVRLDCRPLLPTCSYASRSDNPSFLPTSLNASSSFSAKSGSSPYRFATSGYCDSRAASANSPACGASASSMVVLINSRNCAGS